GGVVADLHEAPIATVPGARIVAAFAHNDAADQRFRHAVERGVAADLAVHRAGGNIPIGGHVGEMRREAVLGGRHRAVEGAATEQQNRQGTARDEQPAHGQEGQYGRNSDWLSPDRASPDRYTPAASAAP